MPQGSSCRCPAPPGGRVQCEPGQAAFCWIDEDGELYSQCITMHVAPQDSIAALGGSGGAFSAWLTRTISAICKADPEEVERAVNKIHVDQMLAISDEARQLSFQFSNGVQLNVTLPIESDYSSLFMLQSSASDWSQGGSDTSTTT